MASETANSPAMDHRQVRKVRIDEDQAGQRIDNFLRRELPGVPKSRLYRILRRGEVRVNGGRVRGEYKFLAYEDVDGVGLSRGNEFSLAVGLTF